jgi:UDP-N-acetylmuramate--alanine ligase
MDLRGEKIHMIGIGGIGMSALALILSRMGVSVSGSDTEENSIIKKLRKTGITVKIGHECSHIKNASLIVYSSSIRKNNPELQAAKKKKIPAIPRIALLKAVMDKYKTRIAVLGTHGKTTITAMASLLARNGRMDPTVLIGGESPHFQGNAKFGKKNTLVAEVDESDGRFVVLRPTHIIIPNLEWEHAEHYRDEGHLLDVFRDFVSAQSPRGVFFYRVEDANLRKLARAARGRVVSFGFSDAADIYAAGIKIGIGKITFDCFRKKSKIGRFTLNIPGVHNVINALAVISLGLESGVDHAIIKKTISSYKNVRRRFDIIGAAKGAKVVEDYAHHPTEIRAVISAAHSTRPGRLITVFQPHRYTRTKSFRKEFSDSFGGSNEVILTDVYSASEDKIKGAGTEGIYDLMAKSNSVPVKLLKKDKIPGYLSGRVRSGDLILVLGAGDIGKTAREVLARLKK